MNTETNNAADAKKPEAIKKPEVLITGAGGALAQTVIARLKEHYQLVLVDFRRRVRIDEGMASYQVEYN